MKFRFPIVIIDEDFRSENSSGLGIRAMAQAIEDEGFEVLGATNYGDLSQFAQQQSRASAFVLSIDDEEFTPGPDLDPVGARTDGGKQRKGRGQLPGEVMDAEIGAIQAQVFGPDREVDGLQQDIAGRADLRSAVRRPVAE